MAVPAQASNQLSNGHIQGNVDLAPGVAIAPGVFLGAEPGCHLVISSGVCLGADVVVQACRGDLVLEPGVSLGSGVLIVGHGFIGQHTCIGSNSTVINPALGASQVVPPGALVGDPTEARPPQQPNHSAAEASFGAGHGANGEGNGAGVNSSRGNSSNWVTQHDGNGQGGTVQNGSNSNGSDANGSSVYGKAQVNRLLTTLFPHRQGLNGTTPGDKP